MLLEMGLLQTCSEPLGDTGAEELQSTCRKTRDCCP